MERYVLLDESGRYVRLVQPSETAYVPSYTEKLEEAETFETAKAASMRATDTETVWNVFDLLRPPTKLTI